MNARVESARAGEHGRGFAVVAAEVRALAQRSAQAAKEIGTLIAESVGKVEQGHQIAEAASETMRGIVSRVEQVSTIMGEIHVASREQSAGLEQVNLAVTQIGEATQQNAGLVVTAEQAAAELKQQGMRLAEGRQRVQDHVRRGGDGLVVRSWRWTMDDGRLMRVACRVSRLRRSLW